MQHATQSLRSFLRSLADGVDKGSPLRWADCVFLGSIRGDELTVYDTSGEGSRHERVGRSDAMEVPKGNGKQVAKPSPDFLRGTITRSM